MDIWDMGGMHKVNQLDNSGIKTYLFPALG